LTALQLPSPPICPVQNEVKKGEYEKNLNIEVKQLGIFTGFDRTL
jgi:hypothetical protein